MIVIISSISLTAKNGNLTKINVNDEVVIAHLTTTPIRLNLCCEKTIENLQEIPEISKIIMSVPKYSERFQKEYNKIEWAVKYPKLYVNFIEKDHGPATKYLGLYELDNDIKSDWKLGTVEKRNTYFFICDDDILYKKDLIHKMLEKARKNESADIFTNARYALFGSLRGFSGMLTRPSFFKNEMQVMPITQSCFKVDDHWLMAYIKTHSLKLSGTYLVNIFDTKYTSILKEMSMYADDPEGQPLGKVINNDLIKQCATELHLHNYKNFDFFFAGILL